MSWPTVKLGTLADFRNGLNFKLANAGEGLKFIGVPDFQDRLIPDYNSLEEINPEGVAGSEDLLTHGDILFVRSNGNRDLVGRSMVILDPPGKVSFSGFSIRLRFCSDLVFPLFYAYLFRSPQFRRRLSLQGSGTNICNLNQKILSGLDVPFPALDEQTEIALFIWAYDDLIENNQKRMKLLEEAARLLYQEWFVRLKFPGHEHTSIVDGVPEGWERAPLDRALLLQRGFDLPIQQRMAGTVPIYGSTGICGTHNQSRVFGPGVVTGRSGTLGEVHYAPADYWPLNTALWVKEFKRVTPLFALFLLRSLNLAQHNGGVSVPTLDRNVVHSLEVLIPERRWVTSFEEFAVPIFKQINNLQLQNEKLRAARDLLLPRLMSGKIVV